MKKTIWQQAAGDNECKNHAKLCLERNVILHGPGKHGKWPDCEEVLRNNEDYPRGRIGSLKRFCEDMQAGDLVVLRQSRRVHGIAIVVGEYEWKEEFGHVPSNGDWDISSIRVVFVGYGRRLTGSPRRSPN